MSNPRTILANMGVQTTQPDVWKVTEVGWCVSDNIIDMLAVLAKQERQQVVVTLWNVFSQMIAKMEDPNYNNHWVTKKYKYPGTNISLSMKTKVFWGTKVDLTLEIVQNSSQDYSMADLNSMLADEMLLRGHEPTQEVAPAKKKKGKK